MGVLSRILEAKRRAVAELARMALPRAPPLRPIELGRAAGQPLRLLCEIKHRSPSAGSLSTRLSVGERASAYQRAGASVVSVLCDQEFFGGSFHDLRLAREACQLPLLCKDFVIHESQLDAARAFGADAVLLIARCLPASELGAWVSAALARGLEPLVEVTSAEEAESALVTDTRLIGVNARDLDTLALDPERAARVLGALPSRVTAIHLSGLATPSDVARVAASRADAALVGEALMREDDPEPLLERLVGACLASPREFV